ncbi:Leucine Rich Repeat [Seminavis robusta]|uniref:Leucine Rich Repeat n=1 Tax=Seminavis robusta TaxID=568900 RepID=A0A9N8DAE0_9STRA|nr:Leucine Rich Repeat [Seminavis robusta]|eukprot:Sro32_g021020.1 Leucine Rich Repeat (697) ;mRNA; f:134725-137060
MNPCQETNQKKSPSSAAPSVDDRINIDCLPQRERKGQDGLMSLKEQHTGIDKQATQKDEKGQPSKTESPLLGDNVKREIPKEGQHSDKDMENQTESTPGSPPVMATKNHGIQSVIFDVTDDIQAMPSPNLRHPNPVLVPGAFHVNGASSTTGTTSRPQPGGETLPATIETASANAVVDSITNNDNNDLAVANLVVEEDLQPAFPEDLDAAARMRQESNNNIKKYGCLGAIFLIVILIIVVVVVVVVSVRGNEPMDSALMPSLPPTSPPTPAPTTLQGSWLALLPDESVHAITDDPESPQSKAWQWLLQDYDLLPYYNHARVVQKFALATLYYATEGSNWAIQTNWLNRSVHECNWYNSPDYALMNTLSKLYPGYLSGFFPSTEQLPKPCDDHGLYQHLWLDQNNLAGFLPTEIYLLSTLKTLSLGYNQIGGTISSHIGQLRSLEGLHITTLQDAGNIPSEIGLLTTLRHIGLRDNNHQGRIPTELWLLTNLNHLLMGLNPDLQGSIPVEVGNLSNLTWLGLGGGSLTGTIPTELGQISSLALLTMRDNHLTGTVPSELGLLTGLAITLNLRSNQLSGTIPSELGLFSGLAELELRDNHFTGQIPSEFGQLKSMGHLTFAGNDLSGTLPEELGALQQSLHTLRMEDNPQLSGTIPIGICSFNNSCISNAIDTCEGPFGLSFDCSGLLCGCGCICDER